MFRQLNVLISRLLRVDRAAQGIEAMNRVGRGEMSTYQKTLAMHIASTTQSAGRGWAR